MAILRASASAEGAEPAWRPSARAARRPIRRAIASATAAALRSKPRPRPAASRLLRPTRPSTSPRRSSPRASALSGERKQVTVLFVDVSGFTSLSERLDPEDVHQLMSRAFDLMLAEVHRYEGTVNQFLGDGIMALFGAPIAHEDHARRAVHAALGIARALEAYQAELAPRGISFRARQGLNTGLVVVGSIGSDLRMDYTAVGDTTNVAARLQQAGEPGRVTISEATHRLVHGYFETRALGALQLKGKAEPIAAWEVVAAHEARTRLEVEADRGLTPFVGRERELGSLLDAFERAARGPRAGRLPRRRGGHRQVPPASRAPPAGRRRRRLAGGPLPVVREDHDVSPAGGPPAAAVRHRGDRRRDRHGREDRARGGRRRRRREPRRAVPEGHAVHRSGRRRREGHEPRRAARRDIRGAPEPLRARRRAATSDTGDRGPALDRQRQRAVSGRR